MTMAVSKAVEEGATAVICASTGNTSASAAAYAARAGLTAAVVIPEGKIAAGKLAQALAHGARVLALDGSFDDALVVVRELVRAPPDRARQLAQRVPHRRPAHRRLRGVRRARRRARRALHPGGQRGQHQLVLAGLPGLPRGRALAPAAAPLRLPGGRRRAARGGAAGRAARDRGHRDPHRQPRPRASRRSGAMRESGGGVAAVTDSQILAAYRMLAAEEGIFCEPASAAVGGRAHPARRGGRPRRGRDRRLRPHRPRAEGPGHRDRRRRAGAPPARRLRGRRGGGVRREHAARVAHRQRARHLGQPRSGLRLPGRGARPRQRGGHRSAGPGPLEVHGHGRGRRRAGRGRLQPLLPGARLRASARSTASAVECRNRIPLGRGLGSSAAAVCAGPRGGQRPRRPALDARRPAGPRQPRSRATPTTRPPA